MVKCRDLPAKDPNLGSSDPYVKLQLLPDKQHKVKTRVLRKTRNPVYDEDFTFYGITFNQLQVYTGSAGLKACSLLWGGRIISSKEVLALFISEKRILVTRYFTLPIPWEMYFDVVFFLYLDIHQVDVMLHYPLLSPQDSNSGVSHLNNLLWSSPLSMFKIKLKIPSYILA